MALSVRATWNGASFDVNLAHANLQNLIDQRKKENVVWRNWRLPWAFGRLQDGLFSTPCSEVDFIPGTYIAAAASAAARGAIVVAEGVASERSKRPRTLQMGHLTYYTNE